MGRVSAGAAGQGPERDVPGDRRGGAAHRQPPRLRQPPLEAARPPRVRGEPQPTISALLLFNLVSPI
jgi:hypothetical protein